MPTLGEELKRRREERGITLADISDSTRIGTRFLKAIESDNFSILPGGIFTRSFIRAYAKEVGMNEDEAVGMYQQQTGAQAAPSSQQPAAETGATKTRTINKTLSIEQIEKPRKRSEPMIYRPSSPPMSWPSIIIAGGIIIFIVIVVIALVKQLNKGSGETAPQPAASTQQNTQPAQPAEPSQPEPAPVAATGQLTVRIEALKGSWIQYRTDDGRPKSMIMKTGQTEEFTADSQVKLDYGTLQTISITVNNQPASIPPEAPQRDGHLLITRDGVQIAN